MSQALVKSKFAGEFKFLNQKLIWIFDKNLTLKTWTSKVEKEFSKSFQIYIFHPKSKFKLKLDKLERCDL